MTTEDAVVAEIDEKGSSDELAMLDVLFTEPATVEVSPPAEATTPELSNENPDAPPEVTIENSDAPPEVSNENSDAQPEVTSENPDAPLEVTAENLDAQPEVTTENQDALPEVSIENPDTPPVVADSDILTQLEPLADLTDESEALPALSAEEEEYFLAKKRGEKRSCEEEAEVEREPKSPKIE